MTKQNQNPTVNGPERGGTRPRPDYTAQKVDAIPEDITLPRTGPRVDPEFTDGIQKAMAEPGTPWIVGTYFSDNGAANMHKRIKKGDIKLPYGDWVIESRRMWATDADGNILNDDEGKPKRWSRLYAIYEGPVSDDE